MLRGSGAYDLVGFQTDEHAPHSATAPGMLGAAFARRQRSYAATVAAARLAIPIGIDAEGFAARPRARDAARCQALARAAWPAGRWRSASTGWITPRACRNRFEAFGRLLARHPEHRRKVSLLQIAPRSREDVDEYRKLRRELDRVAGAHQRPFRRVRLDAAALLDRAGAARDPGRPLSRSPASAW